jgi:hypothetical protein
MRIDPNSLSATVDSVNEDVFEGRTASAAERKRVAKWIAERQGLPGAYAGMFAGLEAERKDGITAFTGERFTSASARHILGEESSRALRLLEVKDAGVQAALDRATAGMLCVLQGVAADPRSTNPGVYCCGKCTVGLWRNLLAGGLDRQEERMTRGLSHLRSLRDGKGDWRRFPLWYTVLGLVDMDMPEARRELKYVAAQLERTAERPPRGASIYARRRHELARRALARV